MFPLDLLHGKPRKDEESFSFKTWQDFGQALEGSSIVLHLSPFPLSRPKPTALGIDCFPAATLDLSTAHY
jgi:hypothetical protein